LNSFSRGESSLSVRGSSFDFSEEERIVAALERQNKKKKQQTNGKTGTGGKSRKFVPGAPTLTQIREEGAAAEGGGIGRKLGELLRPLWREVIKILKNPLLDWRKVGKAAVVALLAILIGYSLLFVLFSFCHLVGEC
jgi:hypothetical protein